MATYIINNQEYYFKDEIGQEEAEKRIAERSSPVEEPGNSDSYETHTRECWQPNSWRV